MRRAAVRNGGDEMRAVGRIGVAVVAAAAVMAGAGALVTAQGGYGSAPASSTSSGATTTTPSSASSRTSATTGGMSGTASTTTQTTSHATSGAAASAGTGALGQSVAMASTAFDQSGGLGTGAGGPAAEAMMTRFGSAFRDGLWGNIPGISVAGTPAAPLPWVLKRGSAILLKNGTFYVYGAGLVFPAKGDTAGGQPVPAALVGTTGPVKTLVASLNCANDPGHPLLTPPFPLQKNGDFWMETTLSLPTHCTAPVVLVGPPKAGSDQMAAWFATTNFLIYGETENTYWGW